MATGSGVQAMQGLIEELEGKLQEVMDSIAAKSEPQNKDKVEWMEKLYTAFQRVLIQKMPLLPFLEKVCLCAEQLIENRLFEIALLELYERYMDYMFQAKHAVRTLKSSDEDTTKYIAVVSRFCIGRSYAVYQRALMHDPEFCRLDTVFELREVLKDCQKNFEFINNCSETQREHSYWATYNTMVLILRICRRLRSNGSHAPVSP
jgi:hypothetical protein